jgi:hypothetical protein
MPTLRYILLLTLSLAQAGPPELFLDLTTPAVKHMKEAKTVGCGSGGRVFVDHRPLRPPQLTLSLEIAWLNQDRFKLGDEVAYEVRLTNTGDKPVVLPWNPDSDIAYGKDCRGLARARGLLTLEASVKLNFIDDAGNAEPVGPDRLFGVRDDPGTYRVLAPQQSARIRVSDNLYLPQTAANASSAGGANHFKAIAVFDLRDSSLPNPYGTVVSTNGQDVTVFGN